MKTVDIKGKDYVMINERIKFFRSEATFKGWSLESDILSHDNGAIVIKATIKDADGNIKATGLAREKDGDGYINKTSYVENCETSAWGRALGNMGIGVDASIASADEVANAMKNQSGKVAMNTKKDEPEKAWLNVCRKGTDVPTPQWNNILNGINEGTVKSVEDVRQHYKVSKVTEAAIKIALKL